MIIHRKCKPRFAYGFEISNKKKQSIILPHRILTTWSETIAFAFKVFPKLFAEKGPASHFLEPKFNHLFLRRQGRG